MIHLLLSSNNFHEEWAKAFIQPYLTSSKTVVIIPFSFNQEKIRHDDDWQLAYSEGGGKYYKDILTPFLALGIDENNINWLNYFTHSSEEMIKLINQSDIIFLTGGLPDQAVHRVVEKGLLESLSKSQMIIGVSAGALMQLNDYYLSPDKDYPTFGYYKGLGLLNSNFYIEVHYEHTAIQKHSIKKAIVEKNKTVYAISNQGGLLVDETGLHLLGDVKPFKGES